MPAIRNSPSTRRVSSRLSRSSSLSTSPNSKSSASVGRQTPPRTTLTWNRVTFVQDGQKLTSYENGMPTNADAFGNKENQPLGDSMASPPSTPSKKCKELAIVGPFHVSLFPQAADLSDPCLGRQDHTQDIVCISISMAKGELAKEDNIDAMLDKVNDALDAAANVVTLVGSFDVDSTLADARAKELTESPLSDVTEAFYTAPSSFPSSPPSSRSFRIDTYDPLSSIDYIH